MGINPRSALAFLHDMVAAMTAWAAAFWLRFNLDLPDEYLRVMLMQLPVVVGVQAVVFVSLGLYRGLWRYASMPDLQRILVTVGLCALATPATLSLLRLGDQVPRSVYVIGPMLLAGMMSGSRLIYRAWKERRLLGVVSRPGANPVLVIGAGRAASTLLKDLAGSHAWRVVGLLDDDARKHGGAIFGVKVLGAIDQVGALAESLGVTQAIIAMPGASHQARSRAVDLCGRAGLQVMTVPALSDIVNGTVSVSALRNVELDDLLGRDPVALDDAGLHGLLDARTVLVTGAGGSIGSELCRQIARFAPARVVLLEQSEYALYGVTQEFRDRFPKLEVSAVIGDVKDAARMAEVFGRYRPQVVFHAAAYKHVPLMEQDNAWQAARNNVLGTLTVARAAREAGALKFVLVSTDKAVNPTNVMGATKRVAERVCRAIQGHCAEGGTQFVIVRFGNVLGSTGSVIPRFRAQIAAGGPVTVTHPEITRYFMSIPEAAQLVLQAALMGSGGQIFVLDMGEPVRIADLARQLIRLSGLTENDIRIVYTGLRPGEKLYEELLADAESSEPTPHPKLRVARQAGEGAGALEDEVAAWLSGPALDDAQTREALRRWVPEYVPYAPDAPNTPNTPNTPNAPPSS